jgi:hypothetical protein
VNKNLKYVGALAMAMSPTANAEAILNKPTFLEAAVTFLTGTDAGIHPEYANGEPEEIDMKDPFGEFTGAFTSQEPCVIQQRAISPPNNILRTFNFTNLPGPQSARLRANGPSIEFGAGVLTLAKNGRSEPHEGGMITMIREAKQLMALQYIRDNFCPGLPEAPVLVNPY